MFQEKCIHLVATVILIPTICDSAGGLPQSQLAAGLSWPYPAIFTPFLFMVKLAPNTCELLLW